MESDVENIVLIGMPGCGKSSVGRELAAISGREFIDLDDEIAKAAKMPVPDIINRFGEAHFRALEAEAAAQAGKKSGVVIACGGGTPLFEENRRALSQNGRLILLERDRNLLPTDGRPLSIDLEALEKARMPVYLAAADDRVENNLSARDTAKKIWEAHKA